LALKSDSLTIALKKNEAYIQSIQKCLTELEYAKFNKDSILSSSEEVVPQVKLSASEEELELRKVAKEEKKTTSLKSEKITVHCYFIKKQNVNKINSNKTI
jgi:hypothetical protein